MADVPACDPRPGEGAAARGRAPGGMTGPAVAEQARPLRRALARYFASRIPDGAEVDDLVQEVFARLAARDSEAPIAHLSAFVFQLAANVLADRGRRRFARHADAHVPFEPERHAEPDIDPHRILAARQDLEAATRALLQLPERTRTIFLLHRLEGRRAKEIAAQLGISVSAVEKHMMRALQHLSAMRTERGR
ncbi:RNA polymerase sigma factor [Phenylobacterium sp.]|uniref:RNA polymerase sigma factor n=1 Tax=Phenylobacterium sp. TaxID=1871053 RepID=UPI0035B20D61